jgi:large subunit ribosomal protein L5e
MTFIKLQKNRPYFMRFQTRFRRRREAKTDYHARKGLVIHDLNKYVAPKYRLVARITNTKVIAQIAYATLAHDKILAEANSKELARFGLHNAYTSYSAAYATGLLLARRLLKTLKMDALYPGVQKIDGNDYDVSALTNESKRSFKAILDIGIRRPTIGNRVFAVMKGVCDGGVHVPHSVRKFPGFAKGKSKKDSKYDAAAHRNRIYGGHIDNYMKTLQKEDPELYQRQFSKWSQTLKREAAKSVEDLFSKVFDQIRKNPDRVKSQKVRAPPVYEDSTKTFVRTSKGKYRRDRKLTREQRAARVAAKKDLMRKQLGVI